MKKLISVRQALEDPAWLGSMLGAESFAVMRTLLIAAMGEALTADEMLIFTEVTGGALGYRWQAFRENQGDRYSCGLFGRLLRLPRDPWPWRARRAADHGGEYVAGGAVLQFSQGNFHRHSAFCCAGREPRRPERRHHERHDIVVQ
jgi:hypothetical protein